MFETPPVPSPEDNDPRAHPAEPDASPEAPVTSRDESGEGAVPASPPHSSGDEGPGSEEEHLAEKEAAESEDPLARAQRERDDLERALSSAAEGEQHLAEGVRLVHSELIAVLERNGVQQFDPQGDRFDPGEHEALSMRSQDGAEPGMVLDVVEKGYRSNGSVLRPARVVVSG
jgi:hypothetical protein